MAVATGPSGFDEAVDLGVGQVFPRPHPRIVYPFGRPAVRLEPVSRPTETCGVAAGGKAVDKRLEHSMHAVTAVSKHSFSASMSSSASAMQSETVWPRPMEDEPHGHV